MRRFGDGDWPPAAVVRRLVRPGDCVVDVGANIGCVTKLLSRLVGEKGCVCSLEPVPGNFDLLAHNVRVLGLANVRLFNCAASSRDGQGVMEIPRYAGGGENIYEGAVVDQPGGPPQGRQVNVVLRKLDGLLADVADRMAFIKIDVEGHEMQALLGAEGLISRSKPALLIEVSGDPDAPGGARDLFAWLGGRGYEPCVAEGGSLRRREPGCEAVDYFFLREEHAALRELRM